VNFDELIDRLRGLMGMSGYTKSVVAAYVIVFSALALVLTFSKAEIPYPLLPYLKFDFGEIPVMMTLLLGGLVPSLATAVIHWIGLSLARGWVLGPLMKFLAVAPMVAGFWLGMRLYKRKWIVKSIAVAFLLGIATRVVVCTVLNTLVLLFVAPEFLTFSEYALKAVGINIASTSDALLWTLTLNSTFNAFHVVFSSIIAMLLFRAAATRLPSIAKKAWVSLEAEGTST
jgi:riboflavin transporter FmnP